MANVEKAFAKLIGRQPSEIEVRRLYQVRDALGLKDNDALWLVLIALESYDALYRKYPQLVADQVQFSVEAQRSAIAAIADCETRRSLATLSDAVSRTSETLTGRLIEARSLQAAGVFTVALLLFGTLCTMMGFLLASGRAPFWAPAPEDSGFFFYIFSTLARTPAGWMAGVIGISLSLGALWHGRGTIRLQRRGGLLAGALLLAIASLATLWATF